MSASRGVVYSLLTVVFVLLLGIAALLMVAYSRHQRLEDTTHDLRRSLDQQDRQIKNLQQRLENCDTVDSVAPIDTSWQLSPRDSKHVVSHN
ncbi:CbtB-domain containing protein [Spirosoma sp. RP8]|uniref:CbtB-domain containing protein n=1 Tax=Spirosoma liriopis TaxID=2937440 RepID=A0ABT0HJW4_9BACT|nr:CbtB-domain containing protein [Spirosoma liriopis]MCK8492453.1 CbtB-domain containing protein [Spirosoma liriopis]